MTILPEKNSYGEVIKSSTLIGAASLLNICFAIIRTKMMAIVLGPSGIGLLGLYSSIADLTRSIAGMGINSSGVRQIAESVGTCNDERIAYTITSLRRLALCTGMLGALLLLVFCKQTSRLTFGDHQHSGAIALLALAVFFGDLSAAQGALIQGMRRIGDLASMNVLGAFYGTLCSLPIVYIYRDRGVAPALVSVAAMGVLTSWWYARKIKIIPVQINWQRLLHETAGLLTLGIILMATGLFTLGAAYLTRIIILHQLNVEAAGCFQAAWALSGVYVGFIMQAMCADFFPRLTASANDNLQCNRLVNEQAEVGLLMAGPGLLGTLTFAPLIIQLFYSAKFGPAVEILRWNCLGMLLQVASWPTGFIVLAKGKQLIFFWFELFINSFYVALVWMCVHFFALKGAGIAFFCFYIAHALGTYAIARHLTQFRWSLANKRVGLFFASIVFVFFAAWYFLPHPLVVILGAFITPLIWIQSLKTLCGLVPKEQFPRSIQRVLLSLRLVSSV